MIASWMLYGFLISLLVVGAAYPIERWAQSRKRTLRWIWAAAFPAAVLLPLLARMLGTSRGGVTEAWIGEALMVGAPATGTGGLPAGPVADGELGTLVSALDLPLINLWFLTSITLLALFSLGSSRLRRRARGWPEDELAGRRVRVSRDVGPAVMGFLRCSIVVPEWVLEAPDEVGDLIVAHEEEHIRARDPQLLIGAFIFLVALPWNLPLWWAAHRMRLAIEIDCDARVLARGADSRAYGGLLLEVSGQRSIGFAPALSNPAEFLERRIRIITRRRPGKSWREPLLALALTSAMLLVACGMDQPPTPSEAEETSASGTGVDNGEPIITPRTVVIPPPPTTASGTAVPEFEIPPTADQIRNAASLNGNDGSGQQPESDEVTDLAREPTFTTMEVRPQLTNRGEFVQELARRYPPAFREAGIGGTVNVWIFIDEQGQVQNTRIQESSGYPQLDSTAEILMREVAQFSPAAKRGGNVPVWIILPVTFETRN